MRKRNLVVLMGFIAMILVCHRFVVLIDNTSIQKHSEITAKTVALWAQTDVIAERSAVLARATQVANQAAIDAIADFKVPVVVNSAPAPCAACGDLQVYLSWEMSGLDPLNPALASSPALVEVPLRGKNRRFEFFYPAEPEIGAPPPPPS